MTNKGTMTRLAKLEWPPPGYDRPSADESSGYIQVKIYKNIALELDYLRTAVNALIERANR